MNRGAVLFMLRVAESREVVLAFRRIPTVEYIYPLGVRVTIPESGPSHKRVVLEADGPKTQEFSVDLPDDIGGGDAFEIVLEAEAVAVAGAGLPWGSLQIVKIEQK